LRNACDALRQNNSSLICEINDMIIERDTSGSSESCATTELFAEKLLLKFDLDEV
jgi:hypothetical protein